MAQAKMTQPEMRQAAAQAVRDFLRSHMLDPMTFDCVEAYDQFPAVLKDCPTSVAAQWYSDVDALQVLRFHNEWEVWRQAVRRDIA